MTANTFAALLREGYEMPRYDAFGVGWQMYDNLADCGLLEPSESHSERSDRSTGSSTHGVTAVRTHVDIQLVGLPPNTFTGDDANVESIRDALDAGVDVVGGIPYKEATRENGVEHAKTIVDRVGVRPFAGPPHRRVG